VPPRHDVEGKIYERLYGPAGENGDAPTHVIGGDDPLLVGSQPEQTAGDAPRGRLAVATDSLRARARTWLATGSLSAAAARRRGAVVAPAPSVARALALVALGIALVAVAALGAFVPDRATEAPPAGGASTERADADPPSADRTRAAELSERRERARARKARRERRARRARASRAEGSSAGSSRRANRVATVPAQPGTTGQVACSSGGGCVTFRSAPSTGSSRGRVVATGPGDAVVTTPGGAAAGDAGAGALGGSGGSSAGGIAVQP